MRTPYDSSPSSICEFLDTWPGAADHQLARLADRSLTTIARWRKLARGGEKSDAAEDKGKAAKPPVAPTASPACLSDAGWLREKYVAEKLGTRKIGRIVGRSHETVRRHLTRHGITLRRRGWSKNPCCSLDWLEKHYYRQRLSLRKCAALAGASHEAIRRWLTLFGLEPRDKAEAATRGASTVIRYP